MEFIDLKRQYKEYKDELLSEIEGVLEKAAFIGGQQITEFEEALAGYVGTRHAIGCGNGTDALILAMMALGIKPDDQVIVPDFTFFATAEAVAFLGAVPIFVDIRADTFNIDPAAVEAEITEATVGIIPVSLFGQVADMKQINGLAAKYGLWVIEDGAQSFGGVYEGKRSGSLSDIGTTSFFPAKPIGAYGDGGALFTNHDELAETLKVLRNHGQHVRYQHDRIGMNSRLDTLQAAVLNVKLRHFEEECRRKENVAQWYTNHLKGTVETPTILKSNKSAWAQYTIRIRDRDRVRADLQSQDIPTAVHYPIPLHKQHAFAAHFQHERSFSQAEKACTEVLSLPMHPFMTEADTAVVADAIKGVING